MNELIFVVLAMVFAAEINLPHEFVRFDQMPKECAAVYDDFLRRERQAIGTEVAEIDFDRDGCAEKLVFNGQSGSGGEGWTLLYKGERGWRKIGEVFGLLSLVKFKTHCGLLVCMPCGWDQATWEYYELRKDRFIKLLDIEVNYVEPIRIVPRRIDIKIYDEK